MIFRLIFSLFALGILNPPASAQALSNQNAIVNGNTAFALDLFA